MEDLWKTNRIRTTSVPCWPSDPLLGTAGASPSPEMTGKLATAVQTVQFFVTIIKTNET